ncbi:hypothetical protein INR49_009876, partial [Caranx melampygus]
MYCTRSSGGHCPPFKQVSEKTLEGFQGFYMSAEEQAEETVESKPMKLMENYHVKWHMREVFKAALKHREITYRDCHHWVVLEFSYQREPIQTDSLPRRYALRPNHDTVDQKGDRVPADIQQDFVPLIIEKRSLRAEDNSLPPTAQCCE